MDVFFRIIHHNLQPKFTEGTMFYRNNILCDTLEDKVRDSNADGDLKDEGEAKVNKETAIPYGIYPLTVTWSPKFKKEMTLVNDVPEFTGIRIHWGATAKQSWGCPLVGKKTTNGRLKNIGMTDKITFLVKQHIQKGDSVFLEIVSPI